MSEHRAESARTWRDYCKHYGPCKIAPSGRCLTPDDPAYIAQMESRYPSTSPGEATS